MAPPFHISHRPYALLAGMGVFLLAFSIASCGGRQPSLEERAQSIDSSLMCPVCPGQTIDQSRVELARQMRALVRENLAQGWSAQQIRDYFVDSYGQDVLAAPPKSGFDLMVWVVPPVAIAASLVLLGLVILAMRRGRPPSPEGMPAEDEELEPYLAAVDRELGIARESLPESREGG